MGITVKISRQTNVSCASLFALRSDPAVEDPAFRSTPLRRRLSTWKVTINICEKHDKSFTGMFALNYQVIFVSFLVLVQQWLSVVTVSGVSLPPRPRYL